MKIEYGGQVMEETKFVSVGEIQKKYLPVSKKVIRKMLTENLDVIRNGNRIKFMNYENNSYKNKLDMV